MALTPIPSTTSGLSPSARARRLRSVLSEWELDEWIDNLDDDDIHYFYNLMMNGQIDDIMDAFRYDMEYEDYGEYNDYDRYYDDYYGFEGYGEYEEEMTKGAQQAGAPIQVCQRQP